MNPLANYTWPHTVHVIFLLLSHISPVQPSRQVHAPVTWSQFSVDSFTHLQSCKQFAPNFPLGQTGRGEKIIISFTLAKNVPRLILRPFGKYFSLEKNASG